MRLHIVFGVFCIGLSAHHLIGCHDAVVRSPSPSILDLRYRTVFNGKDPEIIENNILCFFNEHKDSIRVLETGEEALSVNMQLSTDQREHLQRIGFGRGNIVHDFRDGLKNLRIRTQFKQGLDAYLTSVWDDQNPYQPRSYAALKDLKHDLKKMVTILGCIDRALSSTPRRRDPLKDSAGCIVGPA